MRILLVTLTDILPYALIKVLNPANDYCAIVVDDVETAKKFLTNVPPLRDKIYSFYQLKECVKLFEYDLVLGVSDQRIMWRIGDNLKKSELSPEKFLHLSLSNDAENIFLLRRAMQYYTEHSTEFEMFASGISYVCIGLDSTKFKYKLFNFARGTQDLYYDYQIAKFVLNEAGGGGSYIKYALIGLAPYSFHYDESKNFKFRNRLIQYLITLNDLHKFIFSADECRALFKESFLKLTLPTESLDVNNIFLEKLPCNRIMNFDEKLNFRDGVDRWNNKNYPDTVKENVKILDDYLTLCEKNNVRPIIFITIMSQAYIRYFNKKILREFYAIVQNAVDKHPTAIFFDGWKLNFPDTDFYDGFHLNLNGAAKFSAILNNVIEQLER